MELFKFLFSLFNLSDSLQTGAELNYLIHGALFRARLFCLKHRRGVYSFSSLRLEPNKIVSNIGTSHVQIHPAFFLTLRPFFSEELVICLANCLGRS